MILSARLLGALLLVATMIAHVVSPSSMRWASFIAPLWLRWSGLVLGVLCVPSVHCVLDSLGGSVSETVLTREGQELIMKGPYRWVRHPLYTTGITLLLSIGLMLSSWLLLSLTAIVLLLVRFLIIPREERNLVAQFGEDYISYISRSGRLLP